MSENGKYIYGMVSASSAGAGNIYPSGIKSVTYKDISVLCRDSESVDISVLTKEDMARMLVHHQQTIEKIMGMGHSIIPMKLGTYVSDESEIAKFISCSYAFIKDVTDRNISNIEIDIVALWNDFQGVLKEIGEDKDIRDFKSKLMADPAKITVDHQKQVGMMMAESLKKKKDSYSSEICRNLSSVCLKSVAHEVMDDRMILNSAFLVDKKELGRFDGKVEMLNSEFKDKLRFRYIGPLPCYSFYTFELNRIDSNKIEEARIILSLGMNVTLAEIKKAYKAKALELHPDKNPDKKGICDFNKLNNAYKILSDFCFSMAGNDLKCSLSVENVNNNNLIVQLKG